MAGQRRSSTGSSQQVHGLEFLNFCASEASSRSVGERRKSLESAVGTPQGSRRSQQREQCTEAWAQVTSTQPACATSELRRAGAVIVRWHLIGRAAGYTLLYTIVAPIVIFVCFSFRFIESVHLEVGASYYFVLLAGASLTYAELQARHSFSDAVPLRVLAAGIFAIVGLIWLTIVFVPCPVNLPCFFSAVAAALYLPIALRCFVSPARSLQNIIDFVAALSFGAFPTLLAFGLMYVSLKMSVSERWSRFTWMLSIWTFFPTVLRVPGAVLWIRASPAERFLSPLMFKLYCDLAFGIYAMFVFTRSPAQIMLYALSTLPLMLLHILRGSRCVLSIVGLFTWSGAQALSLPVARTSIVIEAFTAVSARAITCTLLVCLALVRHFAGATKSNQPRLLPAASSYRSLTLDTFVDVAPTLSELPVCLLAVGLLWIIFAAFCWVSNVVWDTDAAASRLAEVLPEADPSGSGCGEVIELERQIAYSSTTSTLPGIGPSGTVLGLSEAGHAELVPREGSARACALSTRADAPGGRPADRGSLPAGRFIVDNRQLQSLGPGLPHYNSKSYYDRCDDRWTLWGAIVEGVEHGDGWLEIAGEGFFPFVVDGKVVLRPAPIEESVASSAPLQSSSTGSASPIVIMLKLIETMGGEMLAMLAMTIVQAAGTAHLAWTAHSSCS